MSVLLVRPAVFIFLVHGFIVICAIVYSKLEYGDFTTTQPATLARLTSEASSGSLDHFKNSTTKEFKRFVDAYVQMYKQDRNRNMSLAFGDLTKAYFFSLTTISTVGNSGMFLQSAGSKTYYVFCIIAGIVMYATAIHHVAVLLLPMLKYACQTQNKENQMTGEYSKVSVLAFSYGMLIVSILLLGISAIFAGHSYIFGLYASFDNVLAIGNIKWFLYLMPWNQEAFVVGLDLFLFLGHSLLYTTVYITIHFIKTGELMSQIKDWPCFADLCHDYQPIGQRDVRSDDSNDDSDGGYDLIESPVETANSELTSSVPNEGTRLDVKSKGMKIPTFKIEDVDSSR